MTTLAAITRFGLRELAQRVLYLTDSLNGIKLRLKRITEQVAPALTNLQGVGPDVASTLLLAAGDNPERLANERSFASLCGTSPVQASSGKTAATGPTDAVTGKPLPPCGASPCCVCTATHYQGLQVVADTGRAAYTSRANVALEASDGFGLALAVLDARGEGGSH